MDEDDVMDSWAKHEKTREVKEQSEQRVIGDDWSSNRVRVGGELLKFNTGPRCGLLMHFFLFHRFVTFSTAVMIGVGEFFTFKVLQSSSTNVSLWIRYVSLFYIVIQAFLVATNEVAAIPFLTDSRILRNWLTRGFLYLFLGVLTLQQTQIVYTGSATKKNKSLKTFLEVNSYMMMSWGLLYSLMWSFCLQRLENNIREEAKASAVNEAEEEKERKAERKAKREIA